MKYFTEIENLSPTVHCNMCDWEGYENDLVRGEDEDGCFDGCPQCNTDHFLGDISEKGVFGVFLHGYENVRVVWNKSVMGTLKVSVMVDDKAIREHDLLFSSVIASLEYSVENEYLSLKMILNNGETHVFQIKNQSDDKMIVLDLFGADDEVEAYGYITANDIDDFREEKVA